VPFSLQNGKPVCTKCNKPSNTPSSGGGGGNCTGCGQALQGAFITAMNSNWHKQCFVCAQCGSTLPGGYIEKNGKPHCDRCVPLVTTTTTGRQQGFTIDPRTGQKKTSNFQTKTNQ